MIANNTDSPTPEQREALKHAAAFAYGYSLTIYMKTYQPVYLERAKALKQDLKAFGCLDAEHRIEQPYMDSRVRGMAAAEEELSKAGLA